MKKALLLIAGAACLQSATAQVSITASSLTYTQDFNTLDPAATIASTNLPLNWAIYEWGTSANADNKYKSDNGGSNSGETWSYGSTGSTDRALGSLLSGSLKPRYGVKFVNNTGATITGFNISYTGEQWRVGNTAQHVDTLAFLYSTTATAVSDTPTLFTMDAGLSFLSPIQTATAAAGLDGNLAANRTAKSGSVAVTIPVGGTIVLMWQDKDGPSSDDGLALDDLSVTFTTGTTPVANPRPNVVTFVPSNGTTNVPVNSTLQITFDRNIDTGAGFIHVRNETMGTTQDIASIPANVSISGKTATISGLSLSMGNTYNVTFDSTAFDTASYKSYGLYDTTLWRFTTVMPVVTMTSLNENFDAACANNALPAGWEKVSAIGNQQWRCTQFGYNSTPAYEMNGFQGGNNVNEDWLITPRLDLSAGAKASISFRAFKKFAGDNLQLLVSSNYNGGGTPSSAVWNPVTVNWNGVDTNWHIFGADLTAVKANPIHLAFKYTSSATDGSQWKLDDVKTSELGLSVPAAKGSTLPLAVVGQPGSNSLVLAFTAEAAGSLNLSIADASGRVVATQRVDAVAGAQRLSVNGLNLPAGLYIVRLGSGSSFGAVKAVVQ